MVLLSTLDGKISSISILCSYTSMAWVPGEEVWIY